MPEHKSARHRLAIANECVKLNANLIGNLSIVGFGFAVIEPMYRQGVFKADYGYGTAIFSLLLWWASLIYMNRLGEEPQNE